MSPFRRDILLSSGARHTLAAVAGCLSLLESYLDDPTHGSLIYDLRRVCLGEEVPNDRLQELKDHQLLEPNGAVQAVLKNVVLAAVRGEGRALHLVSPFTESMDRALAEFLLARDRIRNEFPRQQADRLIAEDFLEEAVKRALHDPSWTRRLKQQAGPDASSEPSSPPL